MKYAVAACLALCACKPPHKKTAHLVDGEIKNRPLRPSASPLMAKKLAIGVKTLEEFCGTGSADDHASCDTVAEIARPEVKLLAVHGEGGETAAAPCYLAIHSAVAWVTDSLDVECAQTGNPSLAVRRPRLEMVGPRLVVTWGVESHDTSDTVSRTELATYLVICTFPAGATGDPRCTKTYQTSDRVIADDQPPNSGWELTATWLDDGRLEFAPSGAPGTLPAEASALVGAHNVASE